MINYKIRIESVRTTTLGTLTNVVKQINFTLVGEEAGQSFALPQQIRIGNPDSENFIPFENLDEQTVENWVADNEAEYNGAKSHIELILAKRVEEAALQSTPLPWQPVPLSPEKFEPPAPPPAEEPIPPAAPTVGSGS